MTLFKFWLKNINRFFDRQNSNLRRFGKQHYFDRKLVANLSRHRKISFKHIKYLPNFLTESEKQRAGLFVSVIVICLALLSGNLFLLFTEKIPKAGGEYTEGMVGGPRFINPILSQTNSVDTDLSRLIFSSLVSYDKDHQLTPDLAESYEISEDQLTYTFYLKKNVKWHDGDGFNADDVVFTFSSIQDSEYKSPLGRKFRGTICEKIDDYAVKFTLKEPFAPFITMLDFGILPEHLWYNIPPANADLNELNKKPIGTGAWKIESLKKDKTGLIKSYTLIANKDYYGAKSYLSKLNFKFYGDNLSAIEALKSRNVDGISFLPRDLREELRKHKNVIYNELEQPQYIAIFFNQKQNSLLQSDYIRQALALSVNKERILNEVFGGDGKILDAPMLPGIDNSSDITKYEYRPEEAAALLEKNDWKLIATTTESGLTEQLRYKKTWDLSIILTVPDLAQYVAMAKIIQEDWQRIGVKTELQIVDRTKVIQESISTRKYQALLFSQNMSADPDAFAFWHSTQNEYPGSNLAIFSNKQVDDILESARKNNNLEERTKKYWEFQNIISKQLPAIFLYGTTYTYPQDKIVKGFDIKKISSYADRFANINEWYVRTKRVFK